MTGVPPRRRAVANSVRSMLYNSGQAVGTSVSLLVVASAGVSSYAGRTDDPRVVAGFAAAIGLSAVAAAFALVFAVLRGGPWLVPRGSRAPDREMQRAVEP
ncbi:hypothetical protein WIS52_24675 [Pseudonocardia nematodicida]|uniref:MFS transporter n=1 Tax=Pseudonocardia nematodicida TaxID=1206997 RepID=A0ABV1KGT8_9PSEU